MDAIKSERVTLPTGETIRMVWLDVDDVAYVRRARKGDESLRESYRANEPRYALMLADAVEGPFDVCLSPPSKYDFAQPYLAAFLERWRVPDLTPLVHRDEHAHEAGAGATVQELADALRVDALPPLPSPASLLIVDDIFEEGKTTAALLHVLRAAGLHTRDVTVVAPLRLL